MEYNMYNVSALHARLHAPHNFPATENRSMPCAVDAADAKFECNFVISEDQAKALAKATVKVFAAKRKHDWLDFKPSSLNDLFKPDTDVDGKLTGKWLLKAVKKTYGEIGNAPKLWMPDSSKATADFRLTNGSECHVRLWLAPWNFAGKAGVQFRLNDVKIISIADGGSNSDPFANDPKAAVNDEVDSFLDSMTAQKPPAASNGFEDEIPF